MRHAPQTQYRRTFAWHSHAKTACANGFLLEEIGAVLLPDVFPRETVIAIYKVHDGTDEPDNGDKPAPFPEVKIFPAVVIRCGTDTETATNNAAYKPAGLAVVSTILRKRTCCHDRGHGDNCDDFFHYFFL